MAEQILRETLEAADGLQLYCEVFPSPSPKAIVVLCHDYGEHVGVYHSLCAKLSQEGYKVYAQDLRGHGKSPGERGYIKNFDDFLEDLDLLLARIQDRESDAKIFLLGQGLGALIATHYTFSRKPRLCGLIFCGLIIDLPLSPWQKTLIRYGGPLLARSTFAPELQPLLLKPELDGFLKGDPLVFKGPLQLQSIKEIYSAYNDMISESPQLACAILSIQSSQSALGKISAIEALVESIMAVDKTSLCYEGEDHHILHHKERDQVIGDIIEWCEARLVHAEFEPVEDDEYEEQDDAIWNLA